MNQTIARPRVVAIIGPTATGKSTLGLTLAQRLGGEVVSCDSTAVYRGFDIGTDKVSVRARLGIPHHLVDVVEPTEHYSAALYAQAAAAAIRSITAAGRIPILIGGTGFYYRALTRGLFPGPSRDSALRDRLERISARRGVSWLRRLLAKVDPASATRIQVRDKRRLIRALEVFFLTKRPLTEHFAQTTSPLADHDISTFALRLPAVEIARRVAARVNRQFESGLLDEIRCLLARGVPPGAHPFKGLVYRQAVEHLNGLRDETATRALIVRENQRYARRQLIWFRKEPNLHWIDFPGEHPDAVAIVMRTLTGQP